jgi:NAD(P)-dependent dehydrogenase (short-subunit alcohol dehydrogenase family)
MMTMQGKVCLITGSTNGIGKSTAHELARMATVQLGAGTEKQDAGSHPHEEACSPGAVAGTSGI